MDQRIVAVRAMQRYIEAHILEQISIEELACLTKYSPVQARRLFLQWTKQSPAEYIRRLKLAKAALMLRDESCRVIDVVMQFGFGSVDGFQRAFKKEFGYNPKEYKTNPVPIYLFTPYEVEEQGKERGDSCSRIRHTVTVQRIRRQARKIIIKRAVSANDYWSYCEEVGCEVWGLLTSIKSMSGEPVCLWLPKQDRNPETNEYVQGVEVEVVDHVEVPEEFEIIEFAESDYLVFRSESYQEEERESVILSVRKSIEQYDYRKNGYEIDHNHPRIQLQPIASRGYIELIPIVIK